MCKKLHNPTFVSRNNSCKNVGEVLDLHELPLTIDQDSDLHYSEDFFFLCHMINIYHLSIWLLIMEAVWQHKMRKMARFLDELCSQSFQVRQSAKSRLPAPLKSRTKGQGKQRSCLFLFFTLWWAGYTLLNVANQSFHHLVVSPTPTAFFHHIT